MCGARTGSKENLEGSSHGAFRVQNLLNYYMVMLVQVLLDCDLFKILVELSGVEDPEVSKNAQKYLKDLTQLMFNLLPNCTKYTDYLISAANQTDNLLVDLKAWSTDIINKMGNYVFDQNDKQKKNIPSRFIYQCENLYLTTQLGLPSHRINKETIGKIQGQQQNEVDDSKFQNLIRNSQVITTKDKWRDWNFDAILEIIESYMNNQQRFAELLRNKFLKRILSFLLPSKMQFVTLDWNSDKNFVYAKTGYQLIKFLLKSKQGRLLLVRKSSGRTIILFFLEGGGRACFSQRPLRARSKALTHCSFDNGACRAL